MCRYPEKKGLTGRRMPRVMAGPGCSSQVACYCSPPHQEEGEGEEGVEGCENSALLHHGTRIRFGCLEFVFAVL